MSPVKSEEKRIRILEAALRVFSDKGYYGSSIPSIANEAGVATGTIYVYFKDKQALANELYLYLRDIFRQHVKMGDENLNPRERFHVLWQSYIHFGLSHRMELEFLEDHHHAPYLEKETQKAAFEFLNDYGHFLDNLIKSGAVKNESIYLLLGMMEGMALGLLHIIWHAHLEPTEENIAKAEQMAWEALRI